MEFTEFIIKPVLESKCGGPESITQVYTPPLTHSLEAARRYIMTNQIHR